MGVVITFRMETRLGCRRSPTWSAPCGFELAAGENPIPSASIASGEQEPDLIMQEATEEEQKQRRAEIDAEIEANRSLEEKQGL
jgi:hypothetical protein